MCYSGGQCVRMVCVLLWRTVCEDGVCATVENGVCVSL